MYDKLILNIYINLLISTGVLGFWGFGVLGFWGFGVLGFGVLGFWGFGVLGSNDYLCHFISLLGMWPKERKYSITNVFPSFSKYSNAFSPFPRCLS